MNRRECNLLLAGGALASILKAGRELSANVPPKGLPFFDTAKFVQEYSKLVHWWQNFCKGPRPEVPTTLSQEDDAFLEDLEHRAFIFHWEQGNPKTGLVLDRAQSDGAPVKGNSFHVASIASTGFGLSAICVAAERNWIASAEAQERVVNTLDFFANRATDVHGWFYHFIDSVTGKRKWNCEISSLDTALLLAGILTVRQKFHDNSNIVELANKIYHRIDFPWMLNTSPTTLSMGWLPKKGFLKAYWNMYAEETMLYLLGIGSPTHPLPVKVWYAWKRTWTNYAGFHFLNYASLFTHQYSQAYVDYRDRFEPNPPYINFFINSIAATLANRAFCMSLSKRFPDYTENVWGVSASDSAHGYTAWGTVPKVDHINGTIVPCAAGGSMMFTPQVCANALRMMKEKYGSGQIKGKPVWGRYGFVDAFNPLSGWVDKDVLGIDQGITLISTENARTGSIWRWFMANPEPRQALKLVGLNKGFPPTSKETTERLLLRQRHQNKRASGLQIAAEAHSYLDLLV